MLKTTTNYNLFKYRVDNRKTILSQIKLLKESMKRHGFVSPIIVNSKNEIMDGQNRLAAAKELKIPVEYKVYTGNGNMVSLLSDLQLSSKWKASDYINYYIKHNNSNYIEFKKFIDDNKVSITFGLTIIENKVSNGNLSREVLKNGKLIVNDEVIKSKKMILSKVNDIRYFDENYKKFSSDDRFLMAIVKIIKNKDYDHNMMIKQLAINPSWITKCSRLIEYIGQFQDIYNYHQGKKIYFVYIPRR